MYGKSIYYADIKRLDYCVRVLLWGTLTWSLYSNISCFKPYFAVHIGIYDTWGKVISIKDANGNEITALSNPYEEINIMLLNPFRYRGYYYDAETEFYYLGSRYYDPEIGRFINADGTVSTGQGILGHNMYAYCLNNPVNMSDEGGGIASIIPTRIHDPILLSLFLHVGVIDERLVVSWDHIFAPQANLGYNDVYDILCHAIFILASVKYEFVVDKKPWRIQMWKGLYTLASVGGEIGIYNGSVLGIPGWYGSSNEFIDMQFDLKTAFGEHIFKTPRQTSRWLNFYTPTNGMFWKYVPSLLTMTAYFYFTSTQSAIMNAFIAELSNKNAKYSTNNVNYVIIYW